MFKIGDQVVGKMNNGFGVTNADCLLEVIEINGTLFSGKVVDHAEKKNKRLVGSVYETLPEDAFEIASQETINRITMPVISKKQKPAEEFKLKSNLVIKSFEDGTIQSTFNKSRELLSEVDPVRIEALNKIMDSLRSKKKEEVYTYGIAKLSEVKEFACFDDIFSEKARIEAIEDMIKFFIEFQFEPNFRFLNTLGFKAIQSANDAITYIINYFKLTNSPYITGIQDKVKSQEFKNIIYSIGLADPSEVINSRFKVYYGSQGTGKTTQAMVETQGRCVVCNNSMLPQDLIEDFSFNDGKPGFKKSILCKCMEEGKSITLDEINLLPFETIRFLQGILDGKKQFNWKGEDIHIKDGFSIIGTMNLMVNGMAFGLPEPLVDRAYDLKESKLSGKELLSALI